MITNIKNMIMITNIPSFSEVLLNYFITLPKLP